MAKKNIYSELIKQANKANFLSVQNGGGRVEIVTSCWVFSTSTEQYRLALANELKGFPVVAEGECYARNTAKGKVGRKEPFDTARVIADAVADAVAVKPTSFIYEIAEATHRVVVSDNAEVILLINDAYYKMAEPLLTGDTTAVAKNNISPVFFKNSCESLLILPVNYKYSAFLESIKPFTNIQILSAKNPTEKAEEPVKEEKPVKAKKAKAEKKPTTKKAETKKADKKQSKKAEPKKAEPVKAEPTNEEIAKAYWRRNEEHKGIEVVFPSSPKAEIRTALKSNGFRWHNTKKMWFAKETKERLALVKSLVG